MHIPPPPLHCVGRATFVQKGIPRDPPGSHLHDIASYAHKFQKCIYSIAEYLRYINIPLYSRVYLLFTPTSRDGPQLLIRVFYTANYRVLLRFARAYLIHKKSRINGIKLGGHDSEEILKSSEPQHWPTQHAPRFVSKHSAARATIQLQTSSCTI